VGLSLLQVAGLLSLVGLSLLQVAGLLFLVDLLSLPYPEVLSLLQVAGLLSLVGLSLLQVAGLPFLVGLSLLSLAGLRSFFLHLLCYTATKPNSYLFIALLNLIVAYPLDGSIAIYL
jgi:hypothetical protein